MPSLSNFLHSMRQSARGDERAVVELSDDDEQQRGSTMDEEDDRRNAHMASFKSERRPVWVWWVSAVVCSVMVAGFLLSSPTQTRQSLLSTSYWSSPRWSSFRGNSVSPLQLAEDAYRAAVAHEQYDFLMANINASYDPCEDFYMYACGSWVSRHTIPPDSSIWMRSFSAIQLHNLDILRQQAEAKWPVLGTFYENCMNIDDIDKRGIQPVLPFFQRVDNLHNLDDLFLLLTTKLYTELSTALFFAFDVAVDPNDVHRHTIVLTQGGISLPSSQYYNPSSSSYKLPEFRTHVNTMFRLAGFSEHQSSQYMESAVRVEVAISQLHQPPAELRDPLLVNNPMNVNDLQRIAPDIPWLTYFTSLFGLHGDTATCNVESKAYFERLSHYLKSAPIGDLQAYAKWRILHASAPDLSMELGREHFHFFGQVILGMKEMKARWKKCVGAADDHMGEILGRYFVNEAFPGNSRQISAELIDGIKDAFRVNLASLTWMSEEGKRAALTKLEMMDDLVGYPRVWRDYSRVYIQPHEYFDNLVQLRTFQFERDLAKLNQPPTKTEWQMTPPTVNAYYAPELNTINFPAGILQPPFFNMSYPVAMNMAGIGMIMGHEITHGFDDQGAKYDGTGKLNPWWDDETVAKFNERSQCLANQYSQFKVLGINEYVNGNLTLGENIADNGGIKEAYTALKAYYAKYGEEPQMAPHLSNDQLFFLSYAQDWCQIVTEEFAQYLLLTDPHSPSRARVNLPLRNFPKFGEAFNCPIGSFMRPKPQGTCTVW